MDVLIGCELTRCLRFVLDICDPRHVWGSISCIAIPFGNTAQFLLSRSTELYISVWLWFPWDPLRSLVASPIVLYCLWIWFQLPTHGEIRPVKGLAKSAETRILPLLLKGKECFTLLEIRYERLFLLKSYDTWSWCNLVATKGFERFQ